jgi:hypothetical protein
MPTPFDPGSLDEGRATSPRFSFRLSLINLGRALSLLARVVAPIAALCVAGLGVLHLLYLRNPARTDEVHNLTIDHFVVLEQMKRAATLPAADIAFLGDSSCLMGVDAPSIERALHLHRVESFCSLAYLGPAGYADMLAGMIDRNAAPKVLVLMFHPAAFHREAAWEYWPRFVADGGKINAPPLHFPRSSLDFLAVEWLGRVIYSPLPGAYALYYGSEMAFRLTIRWRQGSAIDPFTGLNVSSAAALHPAPSAPSGVPVDFSWNQQYLDALKVLGEQLRRLPQQTAVYLVISPVPDYTYRAGTELERSERANQIAAVLGIDPGHILDTPGKMYAAYFAGFVNHLNRWGQREFTRKLIEDLADPPR